MGPPQPLFPTGPSSWDRSRLSCGCWLAKLQSEQGQRKG